MSDGPRSDTNWCSVRPLRASDVVEAAHPGDDGLGGLLADANAASRAHSSAVVAATLGVPLDLAEGDVVHFDQAQALALGLMGLIELLVEDPTRPGPPESPRELLHHLDSPSTRVVSSLGRRHRYVRRLEEHLRRVGWFEPRIDLVLFGARTSMSFAPTHRRLLVQAFGRSTFEADGECSATIEPAEGYLVAGRGCSLRCESGRSIVLAISADGAGPCFDRLDEATRRALVSQPAVSSATLQQFLRLGLAAVGSISARDLVVRHHHPGGGCPVAEPGLSLASGGKVWTVRDGLESALGRLMSGAPVSAEELGALAGLDDRSAVLATMDFVHSGFCEPCEPLEPLI